MLAGSDNCETVVEYSSDQGIPISCWQCNADCCWESSLSPGCAGEGSAADFSADEAANLKLRIHACSSVATSAKTISRLDTMGDFLLKTPIVAGSGGSLLFIAEAGWRCRYGRIVMTVL